MLKRGGFVGSVNLQLRTLQNSDNTVIAIFNYRILVHMYQVLMKERMTADRLETI